MGFDNTTTDVMGVDGGTSAIHTFGKLIARQGLAEKMLVLTKSESEPGFVCAAL